jgi:hypothetical protein
MTSRTLNEEKQNQDSGEADQKLKNKIWQRLPDSKNEAQILQNLQHTLDVKPDFSNEFK